MIQQISGGVCAPKGFRANGDPLRDPQKQSQKRSGAHRFRRALRVGVRLYAATSSRVRPSSSREKNVEDGYAQAVIVNSGNANTCNANGVEIAEKMCALVEEHTGIPAGDVVVASTGVIGQELSIDPIAGGMEELVKGLGANEAHSSAAEAIMTTDTVRKEIGRLLHAGRQRRAGSASSARASA